MEVASLSLRTSVRWLTFFRAAISFAVSFCSPTDPEDEKAGSTPLEKLRRRSNVTCESSLDSCQRDEQKRYRSHDIT